MSIILEEFYQSIQLPLSPGYLLFHTEDHLLFDALTLDKDSRWLITSEHSYKTTHLLRFDSSSSNRLQSRIVKTLIWFCTLKGTDT